jgi:subtilase family serine protease
MDLGDVRTSMKRVRGWVIAALALVLVCASAASAAGPTAGTARLGPAPAAAELQLVLPLAADQLGLEAFARSVSDPRSPQYGRYRSIAWLSSRYGASARSRRLVVGYLRRAGASGVTIDPTGLFADASLSARRAARLFSTPLARFSEARGSRFIAPTAKATVPAALRGAVTGVVGLDTRPLVSGSALRHVTGSVRSSSSIKAHAAGQPTSALLHTGTAAGCAPGVAAGEVDGDPRTAGFTPNQYLSAYGYDTLHNGGFKGQGERVALIEIDGFNGNDIRTFASCFGFDIPAVQAFGVGTHHALAPGGESTLDLEVLDAAAPDLAGIDVYETKPSAATTLRALTAPLHNRGHHPQVISASLGLCEPAVAAAVGIRGIAATEAALAMAAANGITFLASSGDQGSADCSGPGGLPLRRLAVNYPASSPWATAVGGTNLQLDAANHIQAQLVWNDAGLQGIQPGSAAGGGLSRLFRRPVYQKGTVRGKTRVMPDISMLADIIPGYSVFCSANGDCINSNNRNPWQTVGGTSAGTPLLAGGFALVDQQLRMNNREDLGLVNPLLYEAGQSPTLSRQVYSDVTVFGNDVGPYVGGSSAALGCCSAGAGFDAASGWGSLNVAAFSPAAVFLQPAHLDLRLPRHQHVLKSKRIFAIVSCAAACRIGAYAEVSGARGSGFQVASRVVDLPAAGQKKLGIRFTKGDLRRVRSALRHHRRVVATVHGAAIKGRRTIAAQTGGKTLRIR